MKRLNPTFKHIYDNLNLFGENERHILENFYKMNQNESGSKKIVFYTQGMEDEEFDNINVLDINKPLSKEYRDNLLNNHLLMYGDMYHYEDTWDDSREKFKKLGEIRKALPSLWNKARESDIQNVYLNRLPISEDVMKSHIKKYVGSGKRKSGKKISVKRRIRRKIRKTSHRNKR